MCVVPLMKDILFLHPYSTRRLVFYVSLALGKVDYNFRAELRTYLEL